MRVLIPDGIDLRTPQIAVFYMHPANTNADNIVGQTLLPTANAFIDQGWIVIGPNSNGTLSWGDDGARDGQLFDWNWLTSWCNIRGIFLYGQSMGGLNGLNLCMDAQTHGIPVLGMLLHSGVCNLAWQYDNNPNHTPSIQIAYGLGTDVLTSADPRYTAAVDEDSYGGHDPMKHDASAFPVIPFRIYTGTTDDVVIPDDNGVMFEQKLTDANWPKELSRRIYNGGHAALAAYDPADAVAFFLRALS